MKTSLKTIIAIILLTGGVISCGSKEEKKTEDGEGSDQKVEQEEPVEEELETAAVAEMAAPIDTMGAVIPTDEPAGDGSSPSDPMNMDVFDSKDQLIQRLAAYQDTITLAAPDGSLKELLPIPAEEYIGASEASQAFDNQELFEKQFKQVDPEGYKVGIFENSQIGVMQVAQDEHSDYECDNGYTFIDFEQSDIEIPAEYSVRGETCPSYSYKPIELADGKIIAQTLFDATAFFYGVSEARITTCYKYVPHEYTYIRNAYGGKTVEMVEFKEFKNRDDGILIKGVIMDIEYYYKLTI